MCSQKLTTKRYWLSTPFLYALMILLGLISGYSDITLLHTVALCITDVFIKIFKCISLPIIALSIIVTLSNYHVEGQMRSIWRRAISYTFTTTFIAAALSCILYIIIKPPTFAVAVPLTFVTHGKDLGYLHYLSNLIPSSLLTPFLKQQVIGVLLISFMIGIAIPCIPIDTHRKTLLHFFHSMHSLLMVVTRWVIIIIPLALYGFITTTIVQLRGGIAMKGIGAYLLVIVLANLIQGLIILPVWLKSQGIKPFATLRLMMPALMVAFFSKSSVGTLPITIETAEKKLNIQPKIARFVLPLCTSLNMNGCAAFIFATVVYLMQNNGMALSMPMMGMWIIIATFAAIGNAGIPMGCFFLSTSLLASMNVPITLMGIILPFYSLIDMLETALNVWSDVCVTKVVAKKSEQSCKVGYIEAVNNNNSDIESPILPSS